MPFYCSHHFISEPFFFDPSNFVSWSRKHGRAAVVGLRKWVCGVSKLVSGTARVGERERERERASE